MYSVPLYRHSTLLTAAGGNTVLYSKIPWQGGCNHGTRPRCDYTAGFTTTQPYRSTPDSKQRPQRIHATDDIHQQTNIIEK